MNSTQEVTQTTTVEVPLSRSKRFIKTGGWIFYGFLCLLIFTVFKLPDEKIKMTIDNTIQSFLSERGIQYSATESRLSFLFGISYTLKDVTLTFSSPAIKTHIDLVKISPSILPLIIGTYSGKVKIQNGEGELNLSASMGSKNSSVSFKSKSLDLGKLGVLPLLANIRGSGILDGTGSISGDLNTPSTFDGDISLSLKKLSIDSQSVMGFSIPRVGISEAIIDLDIGKAKIVVKTFKLGKSKEDDLQGTISGDIALGKTWDSSNLNIKTRFSLSESILKSFMLLDTILGSGKQADRSYSFNITGTLTAPIPLPQGT